MQIKANTATSNIEVQLKYRRDTLIKLVEASKSAINYEKKLLTDITAMRSKSFNIKDDEGRKNAMALEQLGAKINAVLENYPKLEAIATIEKLMVTADYSEREIAASRRLYNGVVEEFNAALYRFPTKIVAAQLKLYNLPLFAASTIDKQDVNLSLE
jgi:LemA protein